MPRKTRQIPWPKHASWAREDVIELTKTNVLLYKDQEHAALQAVEAMDRGMLPEAQRYMSEARRIAAVIAMNAQEIHRIMIEAGVGRPDAEE
jgi:hypothetical protein